MSKYASKLELCCNIPGNPYVQSSATRKAVEASISTVRSLSTQEAASMDASSGKPKNCKSITEEGNVRIKKINIDNLESRQKKLTQNDGVSLIDELFSCVGILSQVAWRGNDFQIVT